MFTKNGLRTLFRVFMAYVFNGGKFLPMTRGDYFFGFLPFLGGGWGTFCLFGFLNEEFRRVVISQGFIGTMVLLVMSSVSLGVVHSLLWSVTRPLSVKTKAVLTAVWNAVPEGDSRKEKDNDRVITELGYMVFKKFRNANKKKRKTSYIHLADGEIAEVVNDDHALPEKPKRYIG